MHTLTSDSFWPQVCAYPPHEMLDQTLSSVPLIAQTSMSSVLYLIFSKPVLHPLLIPTREHPPSSRHAMVHRLGLFAFAITTVFGGWLVWRGDEGISMGLILVWTCPILLFLW